MSDEIPLASRGSLWRRLFSTNVAAADAGFTSGGLKGKAITAPRTNPFSATASMALIDMKSEAAPGGIVCNSIIFRWFGRNTNNQTFSARIWGIEEGKDTVGSNKRETYEATFLAQFLVTLSSTCTGLDGTLIETADFEADTIALTYPTGTDPDVVLGSNAADIRGAWCRLDNLGFPIIAVEVEEGDATQCNGLYRFLW